MDWRRGFLHHLWRRVDESQHLDIGQNTPNTAQFHSDRGDLSDQYARAKGIFDFSNGWATGFEEKPEMAGSDLAFAGVAVARKGFLECLKQQYVDIGLDVLPRIINKKQPCVFIHHDHSIYFKDIGTIPDYLSCQTEWRKLNDQT